MTIEKNLVLEVGMGSNPFPAQEVSRKISRRENYLALIPAILGVHLH